MSALNVLIPLDGSLFSRRILDSVHRFLRPQDHHLFLMRVVSMPVGVGTMPLRRVPVDSGTEVLPNYTSSQDLELSMHPIFDTQTWESLKAEANQEISQDIQDLKTAGFNVDLILHSGQAAQEIVQAVVKHKIDLVVMASHGRKGLERLFMGSVAEEVFQHIDVPVLMLRPEDHDIPDRSRDRSHILVPLDLTEFSQVVLQHLVKVLGSSHHDLTLLHVAPVPELAAAEPVTVIHGAWSVTTDYPKMSSEDKARLEQERSAYYIRITEDRREQLLQKMQGTQDMLQQAGFKVNLSVRFGDPAEEIKLFAQYEHIDLVAMATHSRVGLERLVLGSVARDILRGTHVPVLMVRPRLDIAIEPGVSQVHRMV